MLQQYKGQYFESSSTKTPEFVAFAREFTKQLKKGVADTSIQVSTIHKGHFEISGFIHNYNTDKYAYFNIGDIRPTFNGNGILYRTAEHLTDYKGGMNNFCEIDELVENLERITR